MFPVVPSLNMDRVVGDIIDFLLVATALGCHTSLDSLNIEQQTWQSGSIECPTFWICWSVPPPSFFKHLP